MNKFFTHKGHGFLICLLLLQTAKPGYSKSYINGSNSVGIERPYQPSGLSFDAQVARDHQVSLTWNKAASTNIYFEVQRSFDQKVYSTVALVMSPEADSDISGLYNFTDQSKELSGRKHAWYRLKEVGTAGEISFSSAKEVIFGSTETEITLFPNPFVDKLKVKFLNHSQDKSEIRLLSLQGNVLSTKRSDIKGVNSVEFDNLGRVSNGMYIIEISINGIVTERQKVIKK